MNPESGLALLQQLFLGTPKTQTSYISPLNGLRGSARNKYVPHRGCKESSRGTRSSLLPFERRNRAIYSMLEKGLTPILVRADLDWFWLGNHKRVSRLELLEHRVDKASRVRAMPARSLDELPNDPPKALSLAEKIAQRFGSKS